MIQKLILQFWKQLGEKGPKGLFDKLSAAQGATLQTQSVRAIPTVDGTNRKCLPEIATAPSGPRNDKSGSLALRNQCCKDCQPAWRSTPVKGTPHP